MGEDRGFYYDECTWLELKEIVKKQPVVMVTVGSTEQHGHHLPLDTDNFLVRRLCEEAASRIPGEVLLMPHVPYGFEDHHMDFPGSISISAKHLFSFVLDIAKSIAHHGFERILIANGHGSNVPILDLVARHTILETEALCGVFMWTDLVKDIVSEIRESAPHGGMAHAGELETSLYLYLAKKKVHMEKAQVDLNLPTSKYTWLDLIEGSPLHLMDWWSRHSRMGVLGDPTVASADKGKRVFDVSVERIIDLVRDFKRLKRKPRIDHHKEEPGSW